MSDKKRIYKPQPISGFPEWLPQVRRAEQQWFDHIRRVFESYGFCNIETPSVETLDAIQAKGGDGGADVDKEVYVLERLQREDGDREARLALHFDQTVPLARYTAQHFNDLTFPFKRYQMQRVWRGERPQAGRFREFYQCDIDVINVDNLPLHFDAEMPAIIYEILSSLPGMENEKFQIRISNRKILIGYIKSLGIDDEAIKSLIIRSIDRIEKEGQAELIIEMENKLKSLSNDSEIRRAALGAFINFTDISNKKFNSGDELEDALINNANINTSTPILREGIDELCAVLDQLSHLPEGRVVADLSIVRGLDYYTGTVYETVFLDDPSYGSICSGGRYDDLAGNYINKHLPGVGISIGFSRLFDRVRTKGNLPALSNSPTQILITLQDEAQREQATKIAQVLRAHNKNVEIWHTPSPNLKKQLAYAEKKGIPYLWLLPFEDRTSDEVRDMTTREQAPTKIEDWIK